jgi:hypothetical protein
MRKNPRRILSPQRLPFRHPGIGRRIKVTCRRKMENRKGKVGNGNWKTEKRKWKRENREQRTEALGERSAGPFKLLKQFWNKL